MSNRDETQPLRITTVGNALSAHCVITYTLCVAYGILLENGSVHKAVFEAIFPGFTWLTWPSFFLGLLEIAIYGWYAGALFALLYNLFASRSR